MSIALPQRRGPGRGTAGAERLRRPGRDGRAGDGNGNGNARGRLLDISLDDKYLLEQGRILLTGLQGLVRLPLD